MIKNCSVGTTNLCGLNSGSKKDVERKIVETIISALEKYQITEDQYSEISKYILEKIDEAKTHHDPMVLRELTANWNIFLFCTNAGKRRS